MMLHKFRGKMLMFDGDKNVPGEWVYGSLLQDPESGHCRILPFNDFWSFESVPVDPSTVGPFTGLKDAAGNEIYKGDILKVSDCDFSGEVRWHSNGYFYINEYYPNVRDDDYSPLGQMLRHYGMEVIGNVYDNPEIEIKM